MDYTSIVGNAYDYLIAALSVARRDYKIDITGEIIDAIKIYGSINGTVVYAVTVPITSRYEQDIDVAIMEVIDEINAKRKKIKLRRARYV